MKVGNIAARPFRGFAAAALATAMIAGPVGSALAAPAQTASDIRGNWAESTLKSWVQAGLLHGDSNGRIEPNRPLTRAEWMALANRALGYTEAGDVSFKDLSASGWEYEDVRKAVKAGYISGFADGTIRGGSPVTRQEAAVMLARMLGLEAGSADASSLAFTDKASIGSWSRGAVAALAARGLLSGFSDGSFRPLAVLTRAEAVVLLDKARQSHSSPGNGSGSGNGQPPATGGENGNNGNAGNGGESSGGGSANPGGGTPSAGGGEGGSTSGGNGGNDGNGGSSGNGGNGGSGGGGGSSAAPILTFPVVSDTHVGIEDVSVDAAAKFEQALKVFKTLGSYNAIVVDGDMTDAGTVAQYKSAMSILNANKPAGAKAIISPGNHEYYAAGDELGGDKYAAAERFYKETGMDGNGNQVEPVDPKTENAGVFYDTWVKGYHFIVVDHDRSAMSDAKYEWLKNEIATDEKGKPADPKKPVFVLIHYPYKNTTYGSEGAGWNNPAEYAKFKAVMASHPNAILLTGHTHYTLEHPKTIDASDGFVRINDGSTAFVQAHGYANDDDIYLDKNVSQGLLVKVYSGKVVIERRELDQKGALIGTPYVIDLKDPVQSAKKYSTDAENPSFKKGTKLDVSGVSASSATLAWPKATDDTKVDSYIVAVNGKLIGAPSVVSPYAEAATHTFVAKGLKPNASYTVSVKALDAYGKESTPISATFKTLSAGTGYDAQAPDVLDIDFANVSGKTVKDAAINKNDAVLENNARVADDSLFGKKALVLDGAGARGKPTSVARVPYNSSLFTQDALTIETAVYVSPDSDLSKDEYHILGTYENGGYYLYYSAEDKKFVFDTQNSKDPAESAVIDNVKGKVFYLTAVYEGDAANGYKNGSIKLYVNGAPAGGNTTSGALPINESNDLIIGGDVEAYGDVIHAFEGAIGQVKMYSRALAQEEIAAHYDAFKSGLPHAGNVDFYETDDAAVPQQLRDYAQALAGTKTIDYTFPFQPSALAVLGQDGAVNVFDDEGRLWTGSGTTLKRFDPYASDASSAETFPEGDYFKGTIRALLADDRAVWVLTDQGVSRIRYS
ncbi:S-layer homology domain-containing protein [Cohnella xylanilytica]|uniref:S-layer homology domain-containing protein n=1 Tax=Cohnella xylanilytica TaxID=557555 RepID=A0A841U4M0_9BACL|nr:S-layer homology domain-containing protein [Cohnella xylanilytica]MBB6695647.1 S-layer homology domain-containing protein [Cohnella xylanilytica]